MRRVQPLGLILLLVVTFLAGGLVISTLMIDQPLLAQGEPEVPDSESDQPKVLATPAASMLGNPYLIADIAEATKPAVVLINVEWPAPEQMPETVDPFRWFFGFDFFGSPFRSPYRESQPTISSGSGFIFDEDGYIFTNQHVVGDPGQGQKVMVRLHPESGIDLELEAEVVGSDYELDLAVIKLKDVPKEYQGKLPVLKMGDSDKSRPGEWVIAIGNPYGYEHTVTVGSLSAKGREIQIYDQERRQVKLYRDLLQTDAAINQGNSGGPLINIEGEVIGINTAVSVQAQGIGFAIPINTARAVVDELIETGKVSRVAKATEGYAWHTEVVTVTLGRDAYAPNRALLGVTVQTVTEAEAEEWQLPEAKGALVKEVVSGSAADRAGIKAADVIIGFDGEEITTSQELVDAVQKKRPGQRVTITLLRYEVVPEGRASA